MKVYAFCGPEGAGKDTCADMVRAQHEELGAKTCKLMFAEYLKAVALDINPYVGPSEFPEGAPRVWRYDEAKQYVGDEAAKSLFPGYRFAYNRFYKAMKHVVYQACLLHPNLEQLSRSELFNNLMRDSFYSLNPIVGYPAVNYYRTRVPYLYERRINVRDYDFGEGAPGVEVKNWKYAEAIEVLGYDTAKRTIPGFRAFLQTLGTEVGRNVLGENIWVSMLGSSLETARSKGVDVVTIADLRFPNEEGYLRDLADNGDIELVMVRVLSNRVKDPSMKGNDKHPSATGFVSFDVDYEYHNDGTLEELQEFAEKLVGTSR